LSAIQSSPAGQSVAYVEHGPPEAGGARATLLLVDTATGQKRKVAEGVGRCSLSPDGRKLLYSMLAHESPGASEGITFRRAPGLEWRLFDLDSGEERTLTREGGPVGEVETWIDERHVLFVGNVKVDARDPRWGLLDVQATPPTPVWTQARLPLPFIRGLIDVALNPRRTRLLRLSYQTPTSSCIVEEMRSPWRSVRKLLEVKAHTCSAIAWNGEDELYYGTVTLPAGFYAHSWVYRYDFRTRRTALVLEGDGTENYLLCEVLPARGIVVTTERVTNEKGVSRPHRLEIRDLRGRNPVTLCSSDGRIVFIGWLKG
jgi:hypothetical protein